MSSPVHTYDHHTGAPPTDPKAVKKIEKKIEHEAKTEEKALKSFMKDLSKTEKAEVKADSVGLPFYAAPYQWAATNRVILD